MGTWPTCITTFFFSSLCATEQASVQDQDSTTGRIALIITPKSDSNAHLINISIIIGLIILLEAWESWEEWWRASDCWLPRHLSRGFKKVCSQPLFQFTHGTNVREIAAPLRASGGTRGGREEDKGGWGLSPTSSIFWILSQRCYWWCIWATECSSLRQQL